MSLQIFGFYPRDRIKLSFCWVSLCLPEYLQAQSSLLPHLQTPCWGKHLPTLLSPTESRPACYTSTPKINISTILMWLTDQTAQTTDTRIHTYITEAWATDLASADLSVDVGLLSDAVLQVRDVGLEPVPVADDGGSLHGVAALRPLPSGGQRKKWVWVLVFRSRDEILDGILHQKASSPLIIHTNGSYLELQRLID